MRSFLRHFKTQWNLSLFPDTECNKQLSLKVFLFYFLTGIGKAIFLSFDISIGLGARGRGAGWGEA